MAISVFINTELPRVMVESAKTVADVGDDVTMTCTAGATQLPIHVYWLRLKDRPSEEYSSETLQVNSTHNKLLA